MGAMLGPRIRRGFPRVKVYIFGVDVTKYVMRLVINFGDSNRAPNTAEFVLNNNFDRFVVTEEDVAALYGKIDLADSDLELYEYARNSKSADLRQSFVNLVDSKIRERVSSDITDANKRAVFTRKFSERVTIKTAGPLHSLAGAATFQPSKLAALNGEAARYPYHVGDSIFHSNDPVRIFVQDPITQKWFFGFTGFLSDTVDDVDEQNKRTVTLRCEDVLRIFRYARLGTNPAIHDIESLRTRYDEVCRNFFAESFAGMSLPEIIYYIIFGTSTSGVELAGAVQVAPTDTALDASVQRLEAPPFRDAWIGVEGKVSFATPKDGLGVFDFAGSRIFVFGEESSRDTQETKAGTKLYEKIESLGHYQAQVDHEVAVSDIRTMFVPFPSLTGARLDFEREIARLQGLDQIERIIDIIGRHPELYPVDRGRIMMLLPASLGGSVSRSVVFKDFTGIASRTVLKNRLSQLYDMVDRLDFCFYATPRGDVLLEMPLYDFEPDDFGMAPVLARRQPGGDVETFGPYADRYLFTYPDTRAWSRRFSDDKVRTQLRTNYNLLRALKAGGTSDDIWARPGVATLDALVPQYGIREHDSPDARAYVASEMAASVFVNIKLNQLNADARKVNITPHFRYGIGPNRPQLFTPRAQIATMRHTTWSLTWGRGGGLNMTMDQNYQRGWSGQTTLDGRRIYEPLGGFASRPLNYSLLYGAVDTSGVLPDGELDGRVAPNAAAQTTAATQPTASTMARAPKTHWGLAKPGAIKPVRGGLVEAGAPQDQNMDGLVLVLASSGRGPDVSINGQRGLDGSRTFLLSAQDPAALVSVFTSLNDPALAKYMPRDMQVEVSGRALQDRLLATGTPFASRGDADSAPAIALVLPSPNGHLTTFASVDE